MFIYLFVPVGTVNKSTGTRPRSCWGKRWITYNYFFNTSFPPCVLHCFCLPLIALWLPLLVTGHTAPLMFYLRPLMMQNYPKRSCWEGSERVLWWRRGKRSKSGRGPLLRPPPPSLPVNTLIKNLKSQSQLKKDMHINVVSLCPRRTKKDPSSSETPALQEPTPSLSTPSLLQGKHTPSNLLISLLCASSSPSWRMSPFLKCISRREEEEEAQVYPLLKSFLHLWRIKEAQHVVFNWRNWRNWL